jgi:hypothetical protein
MDEVVSRSGACVMTALRRAAYSPGPTRMRSGSWPTQAAVWWSLDRRPLLGCLSSGAVLPRGRPRRGPTPDRADSPAGASPALKAHLGDA